VIKIPSDPEVTIYKVYLNYNHDTATDPTVVKRIIRDVQEGINSSGHHLLNLAL